MNISPEQADAWDASLKPKKDKRSAYDWLSLTGQTIGNVGNLFNRQQSAPDPEPTKDNTALYVGIGIGVLVLVLIAWYFYTKK